MNRNACESYEVHISALIDGEAAPADVMSVLDHLPGCEACQRFYEQARELQDLVDATPVTPGSTESAETRAARLGVPFALQDEFAADDDAPNLDGEGGRQSVVAQGDTAAEEDSGSWNVESRLHVESDAKTRSARGRIIPMERAPRWIWGLAASLLVALGFGLGQGMSTPSPKPAVGSDGELVVEIGADAGQMTEERFMALAVELLRADRKYQRKMTEVLEEVEGRRFENMADSELASYRDESPSSFRSEEGGGSGLGEALQLSPLQGVY